MNLPNALTILRIFFVPLLVAALVQQSGAGVRVGGLAIPQEWLALVIFLAAAATDMLDGYLARRWKQVTTIGTLLDPIADKLLISAALISLVQMRALPGWMAILIIAREFAVNAPLGRMARSSPLVVPADLKILRQALSDSSSSIACSLILAPARFARERLTLTCGGGAGGENGSRNARSLREVQVAIDQSRKIFCSTSA